VVTCARNPLQTTCPFELDASRRGKALTRFGRPAKLQENANAFDGV
jgi:hypothetical protein